jgi:glutamate synthase domain-containing protein 3
MDPFLIVPISPSSRVDPHQEPGLHVTVEDAIHFEATLARQSVPRAIQNSDRSVGAGLSGELMRRKKNGCAGDTTINQEFRGAAGQSFGAFLAEGVTVKLTGEANDYVGKGLSGGTIVITAGAPASRRGDVLAGNTVLYGATSGQLFIAGRAGERFAVRNSGAFAVVEGVGQHGCEYMTGGVAIILGPLGLNFGSGMTGGLAYVMSAEARDMLHPEFVSLEEIEPQEEEWLRQALEQQVHHTGSPRAARLLGGRGVLPLMRVEPVHFQGSVEATWKPVLAQFQQRQQIVPAPLTAAISPTALPA